MSLFQNYKQQKKDTSNIQLNSKPSATGKLEQNRSKSSVNTIMVQKPGTVSNGVVGKPSLFAGTKSAYEKANPVVSSSKAIGKCHIIVPDKGSVQMIGFNFAPQWSP